LRFSYEITYLKGDKNKVVDSLLHYFSSDELNKDHSLPSYVNADSRLDPGTDDLPIACKAELIAMHVGVMPLESDSLKLTDRVEECELLLKELLTNVEAKDKSDPGLNFKDRVLQTALTHLLSTYKNNKFFAEILTNNSCYKWFNIHKNLIWTMNCIGEQVICVPDGLLKGKSLRGIILEACHLTLGHARANKTLGYIQR
jgi:hypothetical protein